MSYFQGNMVTKIMERDEMTCTEVYHPSRFLAFFKPFGTFREPYWNPPLYTASRPDT